MKPSPGDKRYIERAVVVTKGDNVLDEGQIIQYMKVDKQEALKQLVEHYISYVERYLFQVGVDPDQIADAVEETYTYIYRKFDRYQDGTLSTWLYQLLINTARDYVRKQKKEKKYMTISRDEQLYDQYGYYFEKQEQIVIHTNISKLDMKYRIPLILYYFHGKTEAEIAVILKLNTETLNKVMERARKLFQQSLDKVSLHIRDENHLEELLLDMNYEYERLPDFANKEEVILKAEQAISNQSWKKYIPQVAVVVSLLLFSVIALHYLENQKQQAISETENSSVQQDEETIEIVEEPKELDPEIVAHFELAKEEFANELGLEDVSNFPTIIQIESMFEEMLGYSDSFLSDVTEAKNYIDTLLMLPSQRIRELDSTNPEKNYEVVELINILSMYESYLQQYIDQVVGQLPVEKYDTVIQYQDNVENYKGSEEIKQALRILNEQGYTLAEDSQYKQLLVKVDYDALKPVFEQAGYGEGYLAYVDYFSNQATLNWDDWQYNGELLLEVESLLKNYGDTYTEYFRERLYWDVIRHLESYLQLHDENNQVSESNREVYFQFLEDHKDSILWEPINSTLREWEENNWVKATAINRNFLNSDVVKILFDKRFENVKYEDIYTLEGWPYKPGMGAVYKDYSNTLDTTILNELDPLDIVSLFAYAYVKEDTKMYSLLLLDPESSIKENLTIDWSYYRGGNYALTEYPTETTAIVSIVSRDLTIHTKVQLQKINGIWKIQN